MLTYSLTKEVSVFMSKSLNYTHNQLASKHWSFMNKISESLNYSHNQIALKHWSFTNKMSESTDLLKIISHSFIHSSKCGIVLTFLTPNDMSLSHWFSAGFAYNHWPEGRESVGLRQYSISWLSISNLICDFAFPDEKLWIRAGQSGLQHLEKLTGHYHCHESPP